MSNLKTHLISALVTFTATFFFVMGTAIMSPNFVFSKEAILALIISALMAGVRALFKVIYEVSSSILKEGQAIDYK